MTGIGELSRRTVGPLERTSLGFAMFGVLCLVMLQAWWTNVRVDDFYCDDETIGQGRPCLWITDYVPWHTSVVIATACIIFILFFFRIWILFAFLIVMMFTASSTVIMWLWIFAYYRDLDLAFIWDLVAVKWRDGAGTNGILTLGFLGYFVLLAVETRLKRRPG